MLHSGGILQPRVVVLKQCTSYSRAFFCLQSIDGKFSGSIHVLCAQHRWEVRYRKILLCITSFWSGCFPCSQSGSAPVQLKLPVLTKWEFSVKDMEKGPENHVKNGLFAWGSRI